jgi:hypothetical protein
VSEDRQASAASKSVHRPRGTSGELKCGSHCSPWSTSDTTNAAAAALPVSLATVNRQEASISTVRIPSERYLAISSAVSR